MKYCDFLYLNYKHEGFDTSYKADMAEDKLITHMINYTIGYRHTVKQMDIEQYNRHDYKYNIKVVNKFPNLEHFK